MSEARDRGTEDRREALYNDRPVGPAAEIQLPAECITSLHAVVFDLDPKLYEPGNALFPPASDPEAFHANICAALERHPLARHAEVRVSGTGLHLVLPLSPPAEMNTAGEQAYWGGAVKAVQGTLPVDPDMPGITALTRPVGAVNSKNGATVAVLKPGVPVTPDAVREFLARVQAAPFREVAVPLLGGERISPCPVCGGAGTTLSALDRSGRCYNGCGQVSLGDLYDSIFVKPPATGPSRGKDRKRRAARPGR